MNFFVIVLCFFDVILPPALQEQPVTIIPPSAEEVIEYRSVTPWEGGNEIQIDTIPQKEADIQSADEVVLPTFHPENQRQSDPRWPVVLVLLGIVMMIGIAGFIFSPKKVKWHRTELQVHTPEEGVED